VRFDTHVLPFVGTFRPPNLNYLRERGEPAKITNLHTVAIRALGALEN